jgi:hypothetical protein
MTSPTPAQRFGRSLLLDDGDLVFSDGNLVEIEGKPNLVQALTLRVLTPFGSDRFNVGYGLDLSQAFLEATGVRMVKEIIKLNLVSTVGTDPRVREVRQVTFDDDPERLAAHPELVQSVRAAHHRRVWTVEVDIETATGDTLTLLVNVEV